MIVSKASKNSSILLVNLAIHRKTNLKKDDISLSEEIIVLRDIKIREDQSIIIYPELMGSLSFYLKRLKTNESLFIREVNQQWERKDVYRAMQKFGKFYGYTQINPRRLRATVANFMINSGILIKYVTQYLRHKDIATTLRHYLAAAGIDETRIASKYLHALLSGQTTTFTEFAANESLESLTRRN